MIVIVMGVVGAGKTTVGRLLAQQMKWQFADADDFHPAANIEKIRHGIPLTDEDRWPWLDALRAAIQQWVSSRQNAVLACSALKRSYREKLNAGPEVRFVFLTGDPALIQSRLKARHGHFADQQILSSQLADLEPPKSAISVDISPTPEQIVSHIRRELGLA